MTALATAPARAGVVVHIDKYSQRMDVSIDGYPRYNWPVSTGRSGYGTPSGVFHPQMMARRWFSRKYYNSPMPHSIFFRGGYAIHGSYATRSLGRPASHGCVRLAPGNAAKLFSMVQAEGARISISGSPPQGRTLMARARRSAPEVAARRLQQDPMAYAPYYYAPSVRQWDYDPRYH